MSTVTVPTAPHSVWRDAAAFVWRAWSGIRPRHWAWVLALGLLISLVTLPQRYELIQKVGWHPLQGMVEVSLPLLSSVLMFLGWRLADEGSDAWRSRRARMVLALFATAAVTTVSVLGLAHLTGVSELWAQYAAHMGKDPHIGWPMVLAEYLNMVIVSGMIYAVAEAVRQRSQTQRAFEAAAGRRASLEHQVLESRLAAMQAQVEPRFLFDTLVDIEALYEKDAPRAAANLDRLITYLRAALPRLRESGSTVEAELELVQAYLEVVTAVHGGRPTLTATLADECRTSRFYPMLLLPLIQRAVRHPSGVLPESISIDVRAEPGLTVVVLRIALAGGCTDDPELARVRERLAGLYGGAASLECAEIAGESTELTLRIPAGGASAKR